MGKFNNQKPGDNPGNVYLLRRSDGLYKIGRTTLPPSTRVTELRYTSGWKAELIWYIRCADQITTERALHSRFFYQHDCREWFNLSENDVAWLKAQTEQSICTDFDHSTFVRLDAKKRTPMHPYLLQLAREYLELCRLMKSGQFTADELRELSAQRTNCHDELIRVLGPEFDRPFDMQAHARQLLAE